MRKSWDPRPCKEYWTQALVPTSASVAPTLSTTLWTERSSGTEAVYTAWERKKKKKERKRREFLHSFMGFQIIMERGNATY